MLHSPFEQPRQFSVAGSGGDIIYIYISDEHYIPEVEMKTILGLPVAAPNKLISSKIYYLYSILYPDVHRTLSCCQLYMFSGYIMAFQKTNGRRG